LTDPDPASLIQGDLRGLGSWQPVVLDSAQPEDAQRLAELTDSGRVWQIHDALRTQLRDLAATRAPGRLLTEHELSAEVLALIEGVAIQDYGRWVYYPWSGRIVHTLPPREFHELRLNRNRYKITADEQESLARLTVGIVGLSVGNSIALTLVQEGACGHLRLADFDRLELSNMNRIRTGIHYVGVLKTVIAARQIYELDPYARISLFQDGITVDNCEQFLTRRPRLDIVVDECDSMDVKFMLRERARAHGVPVLMETSDRGILDVERFDLEPDLFVFHGLVGSLTAADLRRADRQERLGIALRIVGPQVVSTPMAASMVEIDRTISTWPQLASDVALGGASVTTAVRRIGLGQPLPSGRRFVDLENLISGPPSSPPSDLCFDSGDPDSQPVLVPPLESAHFPDAVPELIQFVVEHGTLAPSGGNCQPWQFYFGDGAVWVVHDWRRSKNLLDGRKHGSLLALGAAIENVAIAAAHRGYTTDIQVFPRAGNETVVAGLRLAEHGEPTLDDMAELFPYLRARVTNRRLAARQPLESQTPDMLQRAAAALGGHVQLISEPDDLNELGRILGEGDRIRFTCQELHRELFKELRWTAKDAVQTRDGIDIDTLELSTAERALMRLLARPEVAAMIRWLGIGSALAESAQKSVAASSAIGLLRLSSNTPASWLNGGRVLERVWLQATALGLAFQPMTALLFMLEMLDSAAASAVFTPAERFHLRGLEERLGHVLGNPGDGTWAMLFRLAHAPRASARALRLPTDWVLKAGLPPNQTPEQLSR
jgi:tRNA A37 threonylcarbamoyladenosine dehydratase